MNESGPIDPIVRVYVAIYIGYYHARQAIQKISDSIDSGTDTDDCQELFEIVSLNQKQRDQLERVEVLLKQFVDRTYPDFDLKSREGEAIAISFWMKRLQEYINEECKPWELCRMIGPIEDLYQFPEWLGDMYNSCDWVEPNTDRNDFEHLYKDCKRLLSEIKDISHPELY
ncbi:MAG: hypothetical protein Pars92KO_19170 [Parasphingorhabdus sp.]